MVEPDWASVHPATDLDPIQRLVAELNRLPGIGQRTATRLALYIIRESQKRPGASETLARDLARALVEVADRVRLCPTCQNLCVGAQCDICADTQRDPAVLCVVESVQDLRALEATAIFRGVYHVLHGALAPLDGVGPEDLKLPELMARLDQGTIAEVILATNTDVEGDATALYLAQQIKPRGVPVTRLASGIPMGGELEYLDSATLARAVTERREF